MIDEDADRLLCAARNLSISYSCGRPGELFTVRRAHEVMFDLYEHIEDIHLLVMEIDKKAIDEAEKQGEE